MTVYCISVNIILLGGVLFSIILCPLSVRPKGWWEVPDEKKTSGKSSQVFDLIASSRKLGKFLLQLFFGRNKLPEPRVES